MTQVEVWKDIPGDNGYYQVSSLGRVRSKDRVVMNKRGRRRNVAGQMLNPLTLQSGYIQVALWSGGKRKTKLVHQLVLLAFAGPCPDGKEVRHLNSNRADNRLSNLVYGTHAENTIDTVKLGRNGKQKLCPEVVAEIRKRIASGEMVKTLASEYGVCVKTISAIKNRHTYAWL